MSELSLPAHFKHLILNNNNYKRDGSYHSMCNIFQEKQIESSLSNVLRNNFHSIQKETVVSSFAFLLLFFAGFDDESFHLDQQKYFKYRFANTDQFGFIIGNCDHTIVSRSDERPLFNIELKSNNDSNIKEDFCQLIGQSVGLLMQKSSTEKTIKYHSLYGSLIRGTHFSFYRISVSNRYLFEISEQSHALNENLFVEQLHSKTELDYSRSEDRLQIINILSNIQLDMRSSHTSHTIDILTKSVAKNIILRAKQESNLTFDDISRKLSVNKVWLTSAIYGEHPFDEELAAKTLELIGITKRHNNEFKQLVNIMKQIPEIRGINHESYATDPLVSPLSEVSQVYGRALEALITEECGKGIISPIDCRIECDKYVDKSDSERVVIKIDGKFLKYKS